MGQAQGAAMSAALSIQGLTKRYGGLCATDGLSLELPAGELHALIGPNGAGKTTLIGQISGELFPDEGSIRFDGVDVTRLPVYRRSLLGLSRSYQITQVFREFTALENVAMALQAHAGHSFRFWRSAASDCRVRQAAQSALDRCGLGHKAQTPAGELAHGEHRQLELSMALVTEPRMLVLDEPMAGMSQIESEGIVALLRELKGRYTILLVEHDMKAVFALADRITVLVYGRAIATGTPETIRNSPEVRSAYLGDEDIA
jgi:branched-chain amino acid transport system ATP-binding protein